MRGLKKLALLLPALLLGCSDYELNPKTAPPIVVEEPNIAVYPTVLSFGHLEAGMG